jgi:peptidoglycan/xylan/chitin deacetylase (PgdA/CDA1 family)
MRVLTYHRIAHPEDNPRLDPSLISATPEAFKRQMEYLGRRYEIVSIDDALGALKGGRPLSSRAVLITFDDGYRDFAENAWPVLKAYGLPVVLFIPTAYPDHPDRIFWWDKIFYAVNFTRHTERRDVLLGVRPGSGGRESVARLKELRSSLKALRPAEATAKVDEIGRWLEAEPLPTHSVLTWNELRGLAKEGVALGAHTRTHPILSRMTEDQIEEEICGSQEDLAREIGYTRPIFCYPSGEYDKRAVEVLRRAQFKAAFTTLEGHNDLGAQDSLRLCRTNITRRTTLPIFRMRLWRWVSYIDAFRHQRPDSLKIIPNT